MCMCTVHLEQGYNMDSALFVPCYSLIPKWMKLIFHLRILHTIPPNDKLKKIAWKLFSSFKCIKNKKNKNTTCTLPVIAFAQYFAETPLTADFSSIRFDVEHCHHEVKIKDGTAHCCVHVCPNPYESPSSWCWKTYILTRWWAVLLYFWVLQKWLSF